MVRDRSSSPTSSTLNHNQVDESVNTRKRIKRTRAVLVCNRCKSLKTKCDLGTPCGSCIKAKVEDKCEYDPWKGQPQTTPPDITTENHSSVGGPGPSTLENRLNQVESHLSRIDSMLTRQATSCNHLSSSSDIENHTGEDGLISLIAQLPPFHMAEQLVHNYFILDTLLRYTHQPSYLRRFHQFYPRDTPEIDGDVKEEHASYFASVCLAMAIGTTIDDQEASNDHSTTHSSSLVNKLLALHHRFSYLSETLIVNLPKDSDPSIAYYHVHSLMLRTEKAMMDKSSSLPQTWFGMGKTINTALFLNLHQDPDEGGNQFSPFWKEMRRRMWWLLYSGEKIATQKLRLPTILPISDVRRPVLIPDDDLRENITQSQLDDQDFLSQVFSANGNSTTVADMSPPEILVASTGKSAPAEWAFMDAKINSTQIMADLSKLSSSSPQNNQQPEMEQIDRLINQLGVSIPHHLKFENLITSQTRDSPLNAPDQPPWLLAQACVMNIGIASVILTTYQPYLSQSTTGSYNNTQQLAQNALDKSLDAAHRLIVTAEICIWHITFRWPEGKPLFSWNIGSKIFSAGVLLALTAVKEGQAHQAWKGWINDLKSAESLLKILSNHSTKKLKAGTLTSSSTGESRGNGNADLKALKILKQLSERAINRGSQASHPNHTPNSTLSSSSVNVTTNNERLIDPYTSHEMQEIGTPNNTLSSNDPMINFGIPDNFTLEDLEALLTQVYGKGPAGNGG